MTPHPYGAVRVDRMELGEYRERLAAAVAASGAGTFRWDIPTGSLFWDENLDRLFGVARDATAKTLEQFIALVHPDDRPEVFARCRRCAEQGDDFAIEFRVVWPDGTVRWLDHRGKTFRDAQGRPAYMTGACVDVTERKQLESERERLLRDAAAQREQLETKRRLLEAVLAHTPLGILIAEAPTGRIVSRNASVHRIERGVGPDMTDVSSYALLRIWRSEGAVLKPEEYPLARALRGEAVAPETLRFRRWDGTEGWMRSNAAPVRDERGAIVAAVATMEDITDKKVADDALRESERRERERAQELEALLRSVPALVFMASDPECRTMIGNTHAHELVGMAEGTNPSASASGVEVAKRPFVEVDSQGRPLPPEELPMQRAAATGVDVRGAELSLVFDDGTTRHVFGNASPLRDAAGNVRGAIATYIDVTDRKRAEEALRAADRRKDEFLATLAHELRNPLAPIRTGLQLLQHFGASDAATAKIRATMERQLGHMVRLVDDLLDISRITRGKIALRPERVELRTVIAHAVEASRPLVEASGHTLAVELPRDAIWLDADVTRLAQVLTNLLNNSAKYTPNGGHIALEAAVERGTAVIRVTDDGAGIPKEMLSRIFDLFAQADREPERSGGGLGIGLSLARRLAELHGGTIEAQSAGPGRGSTFTVRLPLAVAPASFSAVSGREPARPTGRRRILVVDDNADAAEMLATMLDLTGHETRTAHEGAEAVTLARAFAPEIVFLDLGLPDMSGYEVARRLRADEKPGAPLLVALTGWGAEEDKQRTSAAGFDVHLTKPVDPSMIEAVVARLSARLD